MNEAGEEEAAESGDEALARLGGALGRPPQSMLDNAKALFAFVHRDEHRADPASSAEALLTVDPCGRGCDEVTLSM
ncbi:hypothetical protein [Streptomyces sp. NPDC007905]|uniref:hypothetical protein n=1 Tax=Streptomyces sp. NPDC007905 TaxID=3364788 RepID=UPI0036EFD8F4